MKKYIYAFFSLLLFIPQSLAFADVNPNWLNDRLGVSGTMTRTDYPTRFQYGFAQFWNQENNGVGLTNKNNVYMVGHVHSYEPVYHPSPNPVLCTTTGPDGQIYHSNCWQSVFNFETGQGGYPTNYINNKIHNTSPSCTTGLTGSCGNSSSYWIVGNEPSNRGDGRMVYSDNYNSGYQYAQMFKTYRDFIKNIDSSAKVGTGGIDFYSMNDSTFTSFMDGFWAGLGGATEPDFYSIHLYPYHFSDYSAAATQMYSQSIAFRNWMNSKGSNKPVWAKELGILHLPDWTDADQTQTNTFMDRVTALLLSHNLVEQVFWFIANDSAPVLDGQSIYSGKLKINGVLQTIGTRWQNHANNQLASGATYTRGNLLKNGGFESGDFSNWTVQAANGNPGYYYNLNGDSVFNMYFAAGFASSDPAGWTRVYQDMSTVSSHAYFVSTWVRGGTTSGSIEVCFNDVVHAVSLNCQTKTVGTTWTRFAFTSVAQSATSRMAIKILGAPGTYFFADDASVVDRSECGAGCQPAIWPGYN